MAHETATKSDHIMFWKFKEGVTVEEVAEFLDEAQAVATSSGGLVRWAGGKNVSIEGHTDGYTHAFVMSFESEEARKTYLWHQHRIAFREKWLAKVEKYAEIDI